jgi:hypothetical protein
LKLELKALFRRKKVLWKKNNRDWKNIKQSKRRKQLNWLRIWTTNGCFLRKDWKSRIGKVQDRLLPNLRVKDSIKDLWWLMLKRFTKNHSLSHK